MNNNIEVIEIKQDEIDQAAITLFYAFAEDPMMLWIFGDKQFYTDKGMAVIKTWVKYCVLYGKAIRTNNFEAVAIFRKPGDTKLSFWRMFRAGMLKAPNLLGKEGFKRLMHFEETLTQAKAKNLGNRRYWYWWMIGTKPESQKQGFGQALMAYSFDLARRDNLPIYLETSNENSLQIYLYKGFKILSKHPLGNSEVIITSMIRESN